MAYNVKLLSLAEDDIDKICEYLAQYYPGTPGRFLDALDEHFNNVSINPKMYPKYEYNKEYRRIVCNDYLIFYKTDEKNKLVQVFRILNGKLNINTILGQLN